MVKKRIVGLDLMRVFLALLVFMFHSRMHFECDYFILNGFVDMGAVAMTGFFMLSGYALYITYSDKELVKMRELKPFYIKRAITILPLYFFIAIVFSICDFILGKAHINEYLILFPVETFCLQSTFSSLFGYIHNGGTWFISCIIICYIIYPFLQTILSQISNRSKIILILILTGILLYAPIVQGYLKLQTIYSNPFYRLLEFTIGILLALINSIEDNKILHICRTKVALIISVVLFVSLVTLGRYLVPLDYMLFNWIAIPCFCAIIIAIGKIQFSYFHDNKVLKYLSSLSFSFFLCQVLPIWMISRKVCDMMDTDNNIIRITVSFSLCFVSAVLIHGFVEIPICKYLNKKYLSK